MRPISMDLRVRILKDCDAGEKQADVAKKFSVSLSFVKKLKHQRKILGTIEPLPGKRGRKRALESHSDEIRRLVDGGHARTLRQLRDQLAVDVTLKTVWLELRRLGYRFKKDPGGR